MWKRRRVKYQLLLTGFSETWIFFLQILEKKSLNIKFH
jgi:hypothetical protein